MKKISKMKEIILYGLVEAMIRMGLEQDLRSWQEQLEGNFSFGNEK